VDEASGDDRVPEAAFGLALLEHGDLEAELLEAARRDHARHPAAHHDA
jgi:hypothetical protein